MFEWNVKKCLVARSGSESQQKKGDNVNGFQIVLIALVLNIIE